MTDLEPIEKPGSDDVAERLLSERIKAFMTLDRGHDGGTKAGEGDDLQALLERVAGVYANALSYETRASYVQRWAKFEEWCGERGLEALPASPETVMLYVASAVEDRHYVLSTLRGWIAAIGRIHTESGFPNPANDPAMGLFLKGLSRMSPHVPKPDAVLPLRMQPLREICQVIDSRTVDPVGLRTRAVFGLLSLGLSPAQISKLRWSSLDLEATRLRLATPPTKSVTPLTVDVTTGLDPRICPVAALNDWRDWVTRQHGADQELVFQEISWGKPTGRPLEGRQIRATRIFRFQSFQRTLGDPDGYADVMRANGLVDPVMLRDKALLLVGFAGAFRCPDVCGLRWSDIGEREAGIVLLLRRSKTDQAGKGRIVGIPYGRSKVTCPVTALIAWRDYVATLRGDDFDPEGFIFLKTRPGPVFTDEPLGPGGVSWIVRRWADRAGLDGSWGGRSLRRGFISQAADLDISLEQIASQSGHRTLDSLIRYVRQDNPFRANPATKVGL